jgi:hypothetical protein
VGARSECLEFKNAILGLAKTAKELGIICPFGPKSRLVVRIVGIPMACCLSLISCLIMIERSTTCKRERLTLLASYPSRLRTTRGRVSREPHGDDPQSLGVRRRRIARADRERTG